MKKTLLAGVMALGLAACGGGGKAELVKACVDSGEDEQICNCMGDKLEADLDSGTFKKVAKAMAAGEEKGQEMIENMPADEQGEVMTAMMGAGMSCQMGAAE
jgi:flagellar hook-basal body complex protein FliE